MALERLAKSLGFEANSSARYLDRVLNGPALVGDRPYMTVGRALLVDGDQSVDDRSAGLGDVIGLLAIGSRHCMPRASSQGGIRGIRAETISPLDFMVKSWLRRANENRICP